MSSQYNTNYIGSDYVDLGNKLITRDYLNSVYLSVSNKIITPELWGWGYNFYGQIGNNAAGPVPPYTPVTTFAGGSNWKQVSTGRDHAAGIKSDGSLWVWGKNNIGQSGSGQSGTNLETPTTVFSGGIWKQVSCGYDHTAAIKDNGTLWIWGGNEFGQLGIDNYSTLRFTPVTTFAGGSDWKQVSCGRHFTSAIKTDGTLWSWGRGELGQLGTLRLARSQSNTIPIPYDLAHPIGVPPANLSASSLFTLSSGDTHGAAISSDYNLWLWGQNTQGQLGTGNFNYSSTPVTTLNSSQTWTKVVCAYNTTAAIKSDGTLWLWGSNSSGMLGIGVNDGLNRNTPVTTFAGGTNWSNVSLGSACAMAVKNDGSLWCWGNANGGRIPLNNSNITVLTPTTAFNGGTTDWIQVSMGNNHGSAVKSNGTLWTWGVNTYGQLGVIDTAARFTPVTTFSGGTTWKQVSCGFSNTAAVKTDGTLWIWGDDTYGKLGRGTYAINQTVPVTPIGGGLTTWKQVACGNAHITAVKTDGTLWTWGINNNGQLGIDFTPSLTYRLTPVTTFSGGTNWNQVHTSSSGTTLALKADGSLWTWGFNSTLAFGLSQKYNVAEEVYTFGDVKWKQVSCGYNQSAAISSTGYIWMWGSGFLGSFGNRSTTPKQIFGGGNDWKQVSTSASHTAAVKIDGTLWTWGATSFGRLGNNKDGSNILTPITTFSGGSNWKQVSCGSYFTAAVKTDGTLWTWGYFYRGALGNNSNSGRNYCTPITTFAGGNDWKSVSCGDYFAFGIKSIDEV